MNGKLVRETTHTTDATQAQKIRDEKIAALRSEVKKHKKESIGDVAVRWLDSFKRGDSAPRTKEYKGEQVDSIMETWPDFEQNVYEITAKDCEKWAEVFLKYSPSRYNGGLQVLRAILRFAGRDADKLTSEIEFRSVQSRKAKLPSHEQFTAIINEMRAVRNRFDGMADFAEFLALTGARCLEAQRAMVEHADFASGLITLMGAKGKGGSARPRNVPMHATLREFLKRVIGTRTSGALLKVTTCRYALKRACKVVGCAHLTPHDLRDVFATRCIESGVDIPTVAKWLGHSDGGALMMKTYAHLRDEHSQLMAKRITF